MNRNEITPTESRPNSLRRRTEMRADAETILREIAFVLKLTKQVRAEIEQEQEELVLS